MPFPFSSLRRWPFGPGKGNSSERLDTSSRESTWVIQDGGVKRRSPSPEEDSRPYLASSRYEGKGKEMAVDRNDEDEEENGDEYPSPPPNTPTEVLTVLFRNMEFYRLGPDSLSTFFRPRTRGQAAVLSYMRSEIETLREILKEREREVGIDASAPQVTGTKATLKWLENPSPQSVAELIAARDAAENKLKESKRASWLWGSPTTPTTAGFPPSLPRASGESSCSRTGETPGKSSFSWGRYSDETSTGESLNAYNIGRPRPPSADTLRALLKLVEAERREQEEKEEDERRKLESHRQLGIWYDQPNWPTSALSPTNSHALPVEEDAGEDGESPDSYMEDEYLEDQGFYDDICDDLGDVDCFHDTSYQVAKEARFFRAKVVEVSPVSSDGSPVYENEQEGDNDSGEGESPWRRYRRSSRFYHRDVFWHAPEAPVAPVIKRPALGATVSESSSDEYGDLFYLHKDAHGGQRLVKRLVLKPPYYYPYYSSDGEARIRELRGLLSCPPHSTPSEVILTLLQYKPQTRAFMARKVPGVAHRANQINWGGVLEEMKRKEDQLLYFQWEESEEPLFQLQKEEDGSLEVTEMEETASASTTSKLQRYLAWKKPGKSRLSEAESSDAE